MALIRNLVPIYIYIYVSTPIFVNMPLNEVSANLINIANNILNDSYTTKPRIRKRRPNQSHKHLMVNKNFNYRNRISVLSAYYILSQIGRVVVDYPDLCLCIIGAAREIEMNRWFNEKCVTAEDATSIDLMPLRNDAITYASKIKQGHVITGLEILVASKINFFHTDHHVGKPELEGESLRSIVVKSFGEEALFSDDVYNSIRAFVHWADTRGILYKLGCKGMTVDVNLIHDFRNFPEPSADLKLCLSKRYPAGVSRFGVVKKCMKLIAMSPLGQLLSVPKSGKLDKISRICEMIEAEPAKFHLRSYFSLKTLPYDSSQIPSVDGFIEVLSAVIHGAQNLIDRGTLNLPEASGDCFIYKQTKLLVKIIQHNVHYTSEELVTKIGIAPYNFYDVYMARFN